MHSLWTHLRFSFFWPVCSFKNYICLLTYLNCLISQNMNAIIYRVEYEKASDVLEFQTKFSSYFGGRYQHLASCQISFECVQGCAAFPVSQISNWQPVNISNFKNSIFNGRDNQETHSASACQICEERSNCYWDIAIFCDFQDGGAILDFQNFEILTVVRLYELICVILPNFVKIGQTFAEIWPFNGFSKWRLLYLRRCRGSVWFIISERNSLLFTAVSSLIDTLLFTVYTCSFTVSFTTFYISSYYVSLLYTLIRIVLSILS